MTTKIAECEPAGPWEGFLAEAAPSADSSGAGVLVLSGPSGRSLRPVARVERPNRFRGVRYAIGQGVCCRAGTTEMIT
ncbi:hypothetical protein ACFYY8_18405 [Streptosporangium sp. NPDC001559]|uniref:hypothetical protein n=1 Tax=Streptosporangium sp. NPDC001559 TaxID=3366187 RepID=UPI0036E48B94